MSAHGSDDEEAATEDPSAGASRQRSDRHREGMPGFLDPRLRRARLISVALVAGVLFALIASRRGHPWGLAALVALAYFGIGIAFFTFLEKRSLRRWAGEGQR